MGVTGEDIVLSKAAAKKFPFSVECKNQEKLQIWKALHQAAKENRDLSPLLVFKRNYSKVYVAMEIDKLFKLLEEIENLKNELEVTYESLAGASL